MPELLSGISTLLKDYDFRLGSCVYFLVCGNEIIYVGQTKALPARTVSHDKGHKGTPRKEFDRVLYLLVPEEKLDEVEDYFIKLCKPIWNSKGIKGLGVGLQDL